MKAIILVALLAVAFAVRVPTKHSSLTERGVAKIAEELNKSRFGQTLLHLVQLHNLAKGPVDELVEAIEELISDLNNELAELEENYHRRTAEHNSDVISLEQSIQDAEIDVERADDVIENLLKPRRSQLKQKIANLQENQEVNRKTLAENTLVREQQHEEYESQVAELNSATEAVDEALQLLATLSNPSMLQIKKFQTSLKKIQTKINSRSHMAPMIKALITLASNQNFSDQNIIGSIVDALNEFRNAVVEALNALTAQETQNVADYEERVDQLNAEYAEFQRAINQVNIDLTAVSEKLDQTFAYQQQREQDRKGFVAQLELENTQYAEETDIYTNLKNEYLRELAVSEQGLSVVNSADLSGIHF